MQRYETRFSLIGINIWILKYKSTKKIWKCLFGPYFVFQSVTTGRDATVKSHLSDIWAALWQNQQKTVHPAKTQISLGIRPVWSESSLCTQWVAKDPSFLHADSKDFDQTGRMPRLIWVFARRTVILLVLPWGCSFLCSGCCNGHQGVWHLLGTWRWGYGPVSQHDITRQNPCLCYQGTQCILNTCMYGIRTCIIWASSWENLLPTKCRSACASAQSDQHLCWSLPR